MKVQSYSDGNLICTIKLYVPGLCDLFGRDRREDIDHEVMVGKPVIQGDPIPIYHIVQLVANGMAQQEILDECPQLKKEDL